MAFQMATILQLQYFLPEFSGLFGCLNQYLIIQGHNVNYLIKMSKK